MNELKNLKKAVKRLVAAEVDMESIREASQQMQHLSIHQELDNARTNYRAKLEILERTLTAAEAGHAPDLRGL